jgi:hypothetical protein
LSSSYFSDNCHPSVISIDGSNSAVIPTYDDNIIVVPQIQPFQTRRYFIKRKTLVRLPWPVDELYSFGMQIELDGIHGGAVITGFARDYNGVALSAEMCGLIDLMDRIISIDNIPTRGKTIEELVAITSQDRPLLMRYHEEIEFLIESSFKFTLQFICVHCHCENSIIDEVEEMMMKDKVSAVLDCYHCLQSNSTYMLS